MTVEEPVRSLPGCPVNTSASSFTCCLIEPVYRVIEVELARRRAFTVFARQILGNEMTIKCVIRNSSQSVRAVHRIESISAWSMTPHAP